MTYPNKDNQKLPGVKSLWWVDCSKLKRHVGLHRICRTMAPINTDVHPIQFFGVAEYDYKPSNKANGQQHDTATLKFLTLEELPYGIDLGFIVTNVEGESFLIGSKEHPLPIVEAELRSGKPDGEAAGWLYNVTHVAYRTLIPCIISNAT